MKRDSIHPLNFLLLLRVCMFNQNKDSKSLASYKRFMYPVKFYLLKKLKKLLSSEIKINCKT
jgi:uroporphyrinogen-III decarboxylase